MNAIRLRRGLPVGLICALVACGNVTSTTPPTGAGGGGGSTGIGGGDGQGPGGSGGGAPVAAGGTTGAGGSGTAGTGGTLGVGGTTGAGCTAEGSTCTINPSSINAAQGLCVAGSCECGKTAGEPCCRASNGTYCSMSGLACRDNCVVCGQPGQIACESNACANGGCAITTYLPTLLGVPAAAGATCVAEGGSCAPAAGGATCTAGICGTCGGVNQPCCVVPGSASMSSLHICTARNTVCHQASVGSSTYTCMACGGLSQPCCGNGGSSSESGSGSLRSCDAGLVCGIGTHLCQSP